MCAEKASAGSSSLSFPPSQALLVSLCLPFVSHRFCFVSLCLTWLFWMPALAEDTSICRCCLRSFHVGCRGMSLERTSGRAPGIIHLWEEASSGVHSPRSLAQCRRGCGTIFMCLFRSQETLHGGRGIIWRATNVLSVTLRVRRSRRDSAWEKEG